MTLRSVVLGCGSYLPRRIMTNAELASRLDTSDEWIVQRTGIRQRYLAGPDETTSSLAIKAAQAALRSDRLSSYEQWSLSLEEALAGEYRHGMASLQTGEMFGGLEDYASGGWRAER